MGVKSEKTFEEIVERLAALFRRNSGPHDRDADDAIEIDPEGLLSAPPDAARQSAARSDDND
jgi:hypothetical protein